MGSVAEKTIDVKEEESDADDAVITDAMEDLERESIAAASRAHVEESSLSRPPPNTNTPPLSPISTSSQLSPKSSGPVGEASSTSIEVPISICSWGGMLLERNKLSLVIDGDESIWIKERYG